MSRARQLLEKLNKKIHPSKHCRTCDVYSDDDQCPECGEMMEVIGANSLGGIKDYAVH